MTSFRCPQCRAEVTKEPEDETRGCPCCGYAKDIQEASLPAPYFPWWGIYPPWGKAEVMPIEPYTPWEISPPTIYTGDTTNDKIITTYSTATTADSFYFDGEN